MEFVKEGGINENCNRVWIGIEVGGCDSNWVGWVVGGRCMDEMKDGGDEMGS